MVKEAAGKSSGGVSVETFFKRSHKVIVALTVEEILNEKIARKLT